MNTSKKKVVQLLFLGIFIFLFLTNRVQLWMGLFLLGIIFSFIFGRFYCGWICSINTVMDYISNFKKRMGIKNYNIPSFLKKKYTRWLFLGFFIIATIFSSKLGEKQIMLPIAFLLGIILTFFFHEELWHRYLCPYGSVLSLSAISAKKGISIDKEKCVNCTKCAKVCPSLSIRKEDKHIVEKKDCLVCLRCIDVCDVKAIKYK